MTPADPSRTVIVPVHAHLDTRGSLFEPLADHELTRQRNVHVVLTLPNEVRGNHRHRVGVEITTAVGPCLVRLKENGALRDVEVPAGEAWRFTIPAGVVHAYRNTGAGVMVLISFNDQLHDADGSNTVREVIL